MTQRKYCWLVFALCLNLGGADSGLAQKATQPEAAKPNFDKTGPQVGEQVPDLRLHTLKGEVQRLGDAWRSGPALIVTSSLTCPKSRSRWPELKTLVDKYENRLNIVILYVIEAHPVGSVCPYKDVEDVTPENERDGILRKQPKTLEERLELAQEFKRLLRITSPIYIDNIQDEAWKGLGAAPNLALLVDEQGKVVARSGWFEGKASQDAIERYLEIKKKTDDDSVAKEKQTEYDLEERRRIYDQLEQAGFQTYGVHRSLDDDKTDELGRMLKAVPKSANLEFESEQGHPYTATFLMEAVKARNPAAVKMLLELGVDVKASTKSYASALQIAAQEGDLSIAKMLLAKGADPSIPASGESPLHEAALRGHSEFVKLLLDNGVRQDLYSAIALGEIEMVRQGLKADPSRALRPDGANRMPLDYAAANGRIEIAKLLLAHGAPVLRDKRSRIDAPLHRAIARDDAAMAELLLEAGSSPDTAVGYGEYARSQVPLHLAVAQKNLAIIKLLLAYKANVNARDMYSRTPLHDAAATGQPEIVALLLKAGTDVNVPQLGYDLPCGSGDERIPTNTTPLHFAAASGDAETIKTLLSAGAKINGVTKNGQTPLMFAAKTRRYENDPTESRLRIVDLLIAKGADVNVQDLDGKSALDIANDAWHGKDARSEQDHREMLELLRKHGAKPGIPKPKSSRLEPVGDF